MTLYDELQARCMMSWSRGSCWSRAPMRTAQKTTWCSGPMTPQTPGCDPWSIIVNAPAAEAKMPPVWLLELCAFRGRRSSATWTHRRNASRAANSKKPERAGKRGICGGGCARRLRGGPRVRAGGQHSAHGAAGRPAPVPRQVRDSGCGISRRVACSAFWVHGLLEARVDPRMHAQRHDPAYSSGEALGKASD